MKTIIDILHSRKRFLFAGLFIAAFFAISLGMAVCIVPVIAAVAIYWFEENWRGSDRGLCLYRKMVGILQLIYLKSRYSA